MLNTLREANNIAQNDFVQLTSEFKRDVKFFYYFMNNFNGISIMKELNWSSPDGIFASDSSLKGMGGVEFMSNQYFYLDIQKTPFENCKIHVLEILALIACCKIWGKAWGGKRIIANCDNMCVVIAINTGRSIDMNIQTSFRELFFWCSMFSFK